MRATAISLVWLDRLLATSPPSLLQVREGRKDVVIACAMPETVEYNKAGYAN